MRAPALCLYSSMRKPLLAALLGLTTLAHAADPAPLTPQDRIALGLVGGSPSGTEGRDHIAIFQSVKIWLTQPGRTPDWRTPTSILATAWYDPEHNGYDPMKRVTFNGRPLQITPPSNPRIQNYYALKQPVTPDYEDWLNWYAYLTERTFPQYVAFDSDYGRPDMTLQYPAPYRLNVPANLRVGNVPWSYEIAPTDGARTADYATVTLYPNRSQERLTGLADHINRPGTVLRDIPADPNLVGGLGWTPGTQPGYAAVSACNVKSVGFAGGKRVQFQACTLVIYNVNLTVVR